jgi:hypothetical protein
MAKANKTAIRKQLTAQKAKMTALVSGAEGMAGMIVKTRRKLDQVVEKAKEEHTTTRTLTADAGAAVIAHGANELIALGARAIGEWSQRTGGQEAHFAKNVGLYSSLPQSAIGAAIYIIELATRDSETLSLSLGRDITSRASNLLVNLGLSNTIRAIRYQLAKSIDEDQEANAEKNALINKVAELQKRLDGK